MCTYTTCVILTFLSAVIGGCSSEQALGAGSSNRQNVEHQDAKVSQNAVADMIEVERLVVTEETLTLDYRVNNIYPHDIWMCDDIDAAVGQPGPVRGRYDGPPVVETWIIDDILRIRLVGNLDSNVTDGKHVWTRYRRLAPQQGRSQTLRLSLPVRDQSPVFRGDVSRTSKKPVVLRYILFKIGFFKEDLRTLLAQSRERRWPFRNWDWNAEYWEITTHTPPPSEDPNVAFVTFPWKGTRLLEHSAQFTISDVNIPAQVARRRLEKYSY